MGTTKAATPLESYFADLKDGEMIFNAARQIARSRSGELFSEALPREMREPGWQPIGDAGGARIGGYSQKEINALANHYYLNDPLVNHGVNLQSSYTLGRGVALETNNDQVLDILQTFWREQTNQHVLSNTQAQYELNKERILTGEVFLLFYVSKTTGMVRVRHLNSSEIKTIAYAEDDPTRPIYFERCYKPSRFNVFKGEVEEGEEIKCFIPDYRNATAEHGLYQKAMKLDINTELYIMHICTNSFGGRGVSHIATAINWVRAFKGFMEDRVVLQMAAALFAFKAKVSGNAAALERVIEQFASAYENDNRYGQNNEHLERRQGGTTLFENEAFNLEQFQVDTKAANAYDDARLLRQMVGIGIFGTFEHYLSGDASTGNLATTTAMELPMLKNYEFQQEIWRDIFSNIFGFVLLNAIRFNAKNSAGLATITVNKALGIWEVVPNEGVDIEASVRFPAIVQKDIATNLNGLSQILSVQATTGQAYIPQQEASAIALELLGREDAQQLAEDLIAESPTLTPPSTMPTSQAIKAAVGEPLPDHDAEWNEILDDNDLKDAISEWERLPDLQTLIDRLNITDKELEGA